MITLRLATEDDFDFYYNLKCDEFNKYWSGFANNPKRDQLLKFYQDTILKSNDNQSRKLFIICENETPIGELSIKPDGEEFDMPLSLCKDKRGNNNGYNAFMLGLAKAKELGLKKLFGKVREDNFASAFNLQKCGVTITDEYDLVFIPVLKQEMKMYHVFKEI